MNAFIDLANQLGASWFALAVPLVIQSALLLIILFAVEMLIRRRVNAAFRHALWLLVLIKLILPPTLALPTSLAYWIPRAQIQTATPADPSTFVVTYRETSTNLGRTLQPTRPRAHPLTTAGILFLIWLAGLGLLLAWLGRRWRFVARLIARAEAAPESMSALLESTRQQIVLRKSVALKLSASAPCPAACGFWRPVILIPQQLAATLSPLQLRTVLLHELAHIKRRDIWVNYFQTILQIIYWFHPLLWLANAHIRRLREQAVDETVMIETRAMPGVYPATLLRVARASQARPFLALGLIGILESRHALEQRIRNLIERPIPASAKLNLAGFISLVLLAAVLLPMAHAQRGAIQNSPAPAQSAPAPVVNLDVKFVELSDAALEKLGLGPAKVTGTNGHLAWSLPRERVNELLDRLKNQSGTDVLATKGLQTRSGELVQLKIRDVERPETGPICDLLPLVQGNAIDLSVTAKLAAIFKTTDQPSMINSVNGELAAILKIINRSATIYTVNHLGHVTGSLGTARITVSDGGCAVVQNPAAKLAKEKNVLVIVVPSIVRPTAAAIDASSQAIGGVAAVPGTEATPGLETKEATKDKVPVFRDLPLIGRIFRTHSGSATNVSHSREEILQKLDQIHIKGVSWERTSLRSVLQWLRGESIEQAADKKGIDFMIVSRPEATPEANLEAVTITLPHGISDMRLADVLDLIVKVADQPIEYSVADFGIVFSSKFFSVPRIWQIENWPDRDQVPALYTRRYVVDLPTMRAQNPISADEPAHRWIESYLEKNGVKLDPPKFLFFKDRSGLMMVHATEDDLKKIENTFPLVKDQGHAATVLIQDGKLLLEMGKPEEARAKFEQAKQLDPSNTAAPYYLKVLEQNRPTMTNAPRAMPPLPEFIQKLPDGSFLRAETIVPAVLATNGTKTVTNISPGQFFTRTAGTTQVQVDVKILELSKADIHALGFDRLLNDDPSGPATSDKPFTGILTAPQASAVLKALEQRGAKILSKPRLTTLSGRQAVISILQDTSVAASTAKEVWEGQTNLVAVTNQISLGSIIDVLPHVSKDGMQIEVRAVCTARKFRGLDKASDGSSLPVVEVRQQSTTVTVWDGQTIVLPLKALPGASKNEKTPWYFITPAVIDATGNRIHNDQQFLKSIPAQSNRVL